MLILSRKEGERIRVNHDIVITVIECRSGRVRIGVEAPSNVRVDREEKYQEEFGNNPQS